MKTKTLQMTTNVNFDRIARSYRWLEHLTLGSALQRCRTHFMPALLHQRRALVLGDGDGRFLAALLAANPQLHADAVDTSRIMLQLLREHCAAASSTAATRLKTHQVSALTYTPVRACDLIVSHFFLDCLTQPEVDLLIHRLAANLQPGMLWLVSDFRIPPNGMRLPAHIFVRSLYAAFSLLTGLRTTHLPDHVRPFTEARFVRIAHHHSLFGLLTTELWARPIVHPEADPIGYRVEVEAEVNLTQVL
ncbi:class I SAM-dependent methyltransferase [Granulicella sp. dw_53]|uniref:class I SAM-dependent methyltransferase n=1 Tax=Granulicella sp. dw_53 TaxID=2719792 RepID=UPI0021072B97|nr:class I SAM-dependent methyltransferase [Granulicella sp. dw_53]